MRIAFYCYCSIAGQPIRSQVADTLWNRGLECYREENFHGMIAYLDTLLTIQSRNWRMPIITGELPG